MNDYTPTTEKVRETYSHALWPVVEPDLPDYSQFDRWLGQHDAEVAKAAEQRIVKLLESDKRLHSYFYAEQFLKLGASVLPFVETHAKDCPGCDLIALIKGEK